MPSAEIRPLTAADAAAFWHLRLEALEAQPDAFGSSPDEHRATSIDDTAARLASDPANAFVMGAFVDGALVGIAGFHRSAHVNAIRATSGESTLWPPCEAPASAYAS